LGYSKEIMVKWHNPDLDPEDIAQIIREGREENDKKFETYAEYVGYIAKDNDRILNDHDHSKCEPNEETKKALEEDINDVFVSSIDGSEFTLGEILEEMFEDSEEILDALGSDYNEDGVAYWEDPEMSQRGYHIKQIKGRDDV
jgi:hypothetical protein